MRYGILTLIIFCLLLVFFYAPLGALMGYGFLNESDVFGFLVENVLADYALNSLILVAVVGAASLFIGVSAAWVVARYQFWGRGIFEGALFLPLAFPAYITAYAYTDFLDFIVPNIRSLGGACLMLTLCLYPYIYLFARLAFLHQSQSQIDAALTLGSRGVHQFFHVALPAARPFILVGLALVLMETLADYGTVSYFNVKVFSTGIYNAWSAYGDSVAAARLAIILLVVVLSILWLERQSRAQMGFFDLNNNAASSLRRLSLNPLGKSAAFLICIVPIIFGFCLPFIILLSQLIAQMGQGGLLTLWAGVQPYAINSFLLAFGVSALAVFLALGFALLKRNNPSKILKALYHIAGFGYALPGVVLGLGLLLLSGFIQNLTDFSLSGILSGSLLFLVLGYIIRFFIIPLQGIESAFEKISPNIDDVATMIRLNKISEFWHVRLPLLWPALVSAFLLLFVDIIKELPLTLMLRPFDFDTLAIRAYHLASDERLAQAAIPSLIIAIMGLIPVLILARLVKKN